MKLGIIMDPIGSIHYKKDSTLAMLWEAQDRGWELYFFEQKNIFSLNNIAYGEGQRLKVFRDPAHWFEFQGEKRIPLSELNMILMRKDPPFNQEYIYATYLLELAQNAGVLVVNRPQSLRDANEKLFATHFPECAPPSVVTQSKKYLWEFYQEHGDIVCKPLDTMGGVSVFRLQKNETNANVIFETLTENETTSIIAQRFIPEITAGDKRVLLIDGVPIPNALARIPQGKDWRGNLAVGAKGIIQPLSERDHFICNQIGEDLRRRGLYFAGIDIIGDYLTEINVTSPTGIRELDEGLNINISAMLFDQLEKKLSSI